MLPLADLELYSFTSPLIYFRVSFSPEDGIDTTHLDVGDLGKDAGRVGGTGSVLAVKTWAAENVTQDDKAREGRDEERGMNIAEERGSRERIERSSGFLTRSRAVPRTMTCHLVVLRGAIDGDLGGSTETLTDVRHSCC